MTLRLEDCAAHIFHALGAEPSSELSTPLVANAAGEWFVSSQAWKWLSRTPASGDFVASQDYVTLPTDFGELVAVERDNVVAGFTLVSMSELMTMRAKSVASSSELNLWGAVSHSPGTTASAPTPRLEVYPTPSANLTGALKILYRAGWTRLTASEQTHVYIPTFCEPVYIETLRAFALGWEEHDEVGLSERLAAIEMGPLMQAAMRRDAASQTDYGEIRNGLVACSYARPVSNRSPWRMALP